MKAKSSVQVSPFDVEEDTRVAWAAGILEGEGCFSIHTRKDNGRKQLAIHCEMTDEDVILELQSVLGVGSVCYRTNDKNRADNGKRKPSWILSIQSQQQIFNTLIRIGPFMKCRRGGKIAEMFEILEERLVV